MAVEQEIVAKHTPYVEIYVASDKPETDAENFSIACQFMRI